jgi:hypothetical protein
VKPQRKTRYAKGVTGFILVPLVGIELTTYRRVLYQLS